MRPRPAARTPGPDSDGDPGTLTTWPSGACSLRASDDRATPGAQHRALLTRKIPGPAGIAVMVRVRGGAGGTPGAVRGGACPNLPQRRPGPGSAVRRSAEYQRFSSGASVRSGPLWQIWTNGAAADPAMVAAGWTATMTGATIDRTDPQEPPLGARPRGSPSDPGTRNPGLVVVVADRGADPGRLFSGRIAVLSCLDHLNAVGPPYFVNQVQPHASGPSEPAASRHARRPAERGRERENRIERLASCSPLTANSFYLLARSSHNPTCQI